MLQNNKWLPLPKSGLTQPRTSPLKLSYAILCYILCICWSPDFWIQTSYFWVVFSQASQRSSARIRQHARPLRWLDSIPKKCVTGVWTLFFRATFWKGNLKGPCEQSYSNSVLAGPFRDRAEGGAAWQEPGRQNGAITASSALEEVSLKHTAMSKTHESRRRVGANFWC